MSFGELGSFFIGDFVRCSTRSTVSHRVPIFMKTRIFYTQFFEDNYTLSLSIKERYFLAVVFFNSRVSLCGMYQISDQILQLLTGLTAVELAKTKGKFMDDGKLFFWKDWVRIMNYEKYNFYSGEKNKIALERERASIPSEVIGYRYPIDRVSGTPDTPSNHKSVIRNNNILGEDRIVKGRRGSLEEITSEDIANVAEAYQVPESTVRSKVDDIRNYCASKGKRYSDYLATLRNWVKRDALSIRKDVHERNTRLVEIPEA